MNYNEYKKLKESEEKNIESMESSYTISDNDVIHVKPSDIIKSEKVQKYLRHSFADNQ